MPQLDKNKLYYERFSAVDGYKIKIQNSTNGEIFFGSDDKIKEMSSKGRVWLLLQLHGNMEKYCCK